jgi:hypothetical protein
MLLQEGQQRGSYNASARYLLLSWPLTACPSAEGFHLWWGGEVCFGAHDDVRHVDLVPLGGIKRKVPSRRHTCHVHLNW